MLNEHVPTQLAAYHNGELNTPEAERVAAHLAQCETCRAELAAWQKTAALLRQLPPEHAPDALWQAIEAGLPPEKKRRRFNLFAPPLVLASVAAVVLFALSAAWIYQRYRQPSWQVTQLAGTPRIGAQTVQAGERGSQFKIGDWLQTDNEARALVRVGEIGFVQVEPNTQMQMIAAQANENRLALKRGKLRAFIWAPPKQFYVNTPVATAVDLGCAYDLEVDDAGQSILRVTAGWVAYDWNGIESFVPASAACITRPQLGPGTPYFEDASEKLRAALAQFDTSAKDNDTRAAALDTILTEARQRDALTLWHLLARTQGETRGRVFDRLTALVTTPPQLTRESALRGDRKTYDALWDLLGLDSASWWRIWKGAAPSARQ